MSIQKGIIKLTALAPIFIGSGDELKKTEYFLDRRSGKAYILNVSKFFHFLLQKNLQGSYEAFILNPGKQSLKDWLYEHRAQINRKEIMSFCDYSLDIGEVDIRQSGIKTFVKDAYGNPYIPGSSLKGALRTVLLYDKVQNRGQRKRIQEQINQEVFKRNENERFNKKRFLSKCAKDSVERLLEETEWQEKEKIEHKLMSGLLISDSQVIEKDALVLCAKEDYGIEGKKASSKIPILRECLKPGTEIRFTFILNSEKLPYSIEEIKDIICDSFRNYQTVYLDYFSKNLEYPSCVLPIGGGVGFPTKTLLYDIYDREDAVRVTREILNKQFKMHKHYTDKKVSPRMRKMTHYQAHLYDMGLCEFSYEIEKVLSAP